MTRGETDHHSLFGALQLRVWLGRDRPSFSIWCSAVEGVARGETDHHSLFGALQLRVWLGRDRPSFSIWCSAVEGVARGETDHHSLFGTPQLGCGQRERQIIILYLVLYS